MEKIQFDYYRGMEAEQYSFYRVPKKFCSLQNALKSFLVKQRYSTVYY